jgi:hypothetical protein
MEAIESLLFGIEPVTALVVGVGAVLLAPVIGSVGSNLTQKEQESSSETRDNPINQAVNSVGESAREFAKGAVVWGLGVFDGVQEVFAETSESFQDLMAEARVEYEAHKAERPASQATVQPHNVEILDN